MSGVTPPSTSSTATSPDKEKILREIKVDVAKVFLRILGNSRNPVLTLDEIERNFDLLLNNILFEKHLTNTDVSALARPGTLFLSGTLVYWLGAIVGQLWIPALGFAIGALGAAGITAGFKIIYDQERDFQFLKLFYSCLVLMQKSDKVISDPEKKNLEAFVLALKIPESKKAELAAMSNENLEALEIPDWLTEDQKKNILMATWNSAVCDGVVMQESIFFSQLGDRMGFSLPQLEKIKHEAIREIEHLERNFIQMSAILSKLISGEKYQKRTVLDVLFFLFPRTMTSEKSEELIRTVFRKAETPQLLIGKLDQPIHVLIGSYVLYKACVESEEYAFPENGREYLECWQVIKQEGEEDEGPEVKETIDKLFEEVDRRVAGL